MPNLTIVVPTFKERDNIRPLTQAVSRAMEGLDWELIFVDDHSPDGTAECIRALAQEDRRVRCLERIGRRGLSSAVIEGMLSSSAPVVAVMDADLQHDETLLPVMYNILTTGSIDIIIGSRYVKGGCADGLSGERALGSRLATRFAQKITGIPIQDPLSGFFMLRRESFKDIFPKLSGKGFKILLDLLATPQAAPKFREIPFTFKSRLNGESKMSFWIVWDYFFMVLERRIKKFLTK